VLKPDRYELRGELARGGMGVVYRAVDRHTKRDVALKFLSDPDPSLRKRFLQEGRVLARLRHPHLPAVHELGESPQGFPYLAMELIEGESLHQRVAREEPSLAWGLEVLATVADTVHHCHEEGVVHRDLKPGNVMLERETGRVVLVDFGLVKRDAARMPMESLDRSRMSLSGEVQGTPCYMAPEQAAPEAFGEVGPWSDVYALGAMLFRLLTGRTPFDGHSWVEVVNQLLRDDPPDPRQLAPHTPPGLAALCLRCLSKRAQERPGSAAELAQELRSARAQLGTPAAQASAPASPPRRVVGGVAAGVALAGVVSLGIVFTRGRTPRSAGPAAAPSAPAQADSRAESKRLVDEGLVQYDAGELDGALALLERAVAADPTYPRAYSTRGYVRRGQGDSPGALADYEQALRLDPDYLPALINRGAEHQAQRDFEAALRDYGRAIELNPERKQAWANRASCLNSLGRHQEALADAERAVALDGSFARAYDNRAQAKLALGDTAGALADAQRAAELAPGDVLAAENLAGLLNKLGHYEAAAQALGVLLELEPDVARHWHALAGAHFQLGDYRRSVEGLNRAIELEPRRAASWVDRGSARAKLGDRSGAAADYRRALELEPDAPWAAAVRDMLRGWEALPAPGR
jgi:tetratricopeptide (TPR) repeat protein/predicted Ser/Thr protein kinase